MTDAPIILWFRRDLRTSDHPALLAAAAEGAGAGVLPLFVLDDALLRPAGAPRVAWLFRSLRALSASLDGALVVRRGDPAQVVAQAATCDADIEHAACHLTRQDWGVPIVIDPQAPSRLPLILRGLDA